MWSFIKVLFWGIAMLFTWPPIALFRHVCKKPRMDNCFTFAIRKWQDEEGYLVIRWCRSNTISWLRWPHFLWLDPKYHENLIHFIPKRENQDDRAFPKPFFNGKVQKGDCVTEVDH